MEIPKLSDSEIKFGARELVVECFGSTAPRLPIDLEEIVYEHLYPRDDLVFSDEEDLGEDESGDEILGKMLPRAGRILVTSRLKGGRETGRYRFTVAHEIGHWRLHRPYILAALEAPALFDASSGDTEEALVTFRRSVFPQGASARVNRQEYQANKFAVALLADPSALRDQVEVRFGNSPVYRLSAPEALRRSNLEEFASALGSATVNGLPPMKDVFGLSRQAMGIALRECGFVCDVEPLF